MASFSASAFVHTASFPPPNLFLFHTQASCSAKDIFKPWLFFNNKFHIPAVLNSYIQQHILVIFGIVEILLQGKFIEKCSIHIHLKTGISA